MRRPRRVLPLLALLLVVGAVIGAPAVPAADPTADGSRLSAGEPITPIPVPPPADPRKVAIGAALFADHRLSRDGSLACVSCHDVSTNGADSGRQLFKDGSGPALNTLTVFNAALSFRLDWEGNVRTLEKQVEASFKSPLMGTSPDEVLRKLLADPESVTRFQDAYGHPPDRAALLDAIATYERSLLTPGSRFDRWLQGDAGAVTDRERTGYALFKSVGCASCHQGVNVGGNLFERHGIFRPLASPDSAVLRVPSLRNVATTAPYFHDGSAPTLDDAVREMAEAQLDRDLSNGEVTAIVAFLGTLTGTYEGGPVRAHAP